jgi:excisionase family DNA binding protein
LMTENNVVISVQRNREEVMGMGTQELLTTEQVGEALHLKADTIARKVHGGEIPAVKVGKRWLIRRETLDEMIRSSAPQG